MFYHRYHSHPFFVTLRRAPGGILVGRTIEVELDFCAEITDEGDILPIKVVPEINRVLDDLFRDKLLIDNSDPYADELMKLKRIKAADPVLFDHGTTGPQLAFYVGRFFEDWLGRQKWNPAPDDIGHVKLALSTVKINKDSFFYAIA